MKLNLREVKGKEELRLDKRIKGLNGGIDEGVERPLDKGLSFIK